MPGVRPVDRAVGAIPSNTPPAPRREQDDQDEDAQQPGQDHADLTGGEGGVADASPLPGRLHVVEPAGAAQELSGRRPQPAAALRRALEILFAGADDA
jgi:hypothetical protein